MSPFGVALREEQPGHIDSGVIVVRAYLRRIGEKMRAWQAREPLLVNVGTAWIPMKALVGEPRFQTVLRALHDRLGIEP